MVPPDVAVLRAELSLQISQAMLRYLSPREERVVRLRFGLGSSERTTHEQIGMYLGVVQGRARQLEQRAFKKLRKAAPHLRAHLFDDGVFA